LAPAEVKDQAEVIEAGQPPMSTRHQCGVSRQPFFIHREEEESVMTSRRDAALERLQQRTQRSLAARPRADRILALEASPHLSLPTPIYIEAADWRIHDRY